MLHIDIPTLAEFKALAQIKGETCVSLYLPTSPLVDNIRANRIAFRDLARQALGQLRKIGADKRKIVDFEERFDHLAGLERDVQDEDKIRKLQRAKPDPFDTFWHYQAHGLAVFSTPGLMRMFRLPNSPKPLPEVADWLHLTPLIRAHDVAARYLRAGIGGRKRPVEPRLRQFSASTAADSRPARERPASDTASVLSRTGSARPAAKPGRREGTAA